MNLQSTKHRALAPCLATILLAGIVPSLATAGTQNYHYQSRGSTAELDFASTSGSVETTGFVSATQGQGQNPSFVSISVDEYDSTSGTDTYYYGSFALTKSQFQIDSSLQSASLDVSGVSLQDFFGNSVIADISVTWTGSGGQPSAISKSDYTFRTVAPGSGIYSLHAHSTGLMRNASAAGSFVVNGTDLLAGVPDYSYADLAKSNSVELDVFK